MTSKTISIKGQTFTLGEEEAFDILETLRDAFGWSGVEFSRGDAEEFFSKMMTEDEWDEVRYSWKWRKGLPSTLTERGWDIVREAVVSAGAMDKDMKGSDDKNG